MSRLTLAAGAAAVVYGIGLTALGLRRWPTLHFPPTRIHPMRNTTMLDPQLEQLQHNCPNCGCCTAELCHRAAASRRGCQAHTPGPLRATVASCPCSAQASAARDVWSTALVQADPAESVVPASLTPSFLADPGAVPPPGFVAVRQVTTTAVFMVQEQAGTVRMAGDEPW